MLTIGYARVSTQEQAYLTALDHQVFRLLAAGASKVYADVASRTKDDRTSLMEIMRLVEIGEIHKVIVTRLDRITSSPGLFEKITSCFVAHDCNLSALDETVDVTTVDGEFTAGLQVYFARREVRTIQLRIKKSKEVGRMQGRASSSVPWGYRNVDGRYELDHAPFLCLLSDRPSNSDQEFIGRTKAELGRDVIDLFFKGGSLSNATRLLHQKYGICKFRSERQKSNKNQILIFEENSPLKRPLKDKRAGIFRWSPDGIRLYLLNPVLCGHTPYNTQTIKKDGTRGGRKPISQWDVRLNTHPDQRLITPAQKQQIEQMMAWNGRGGKWGSGATYPLTGIVVCAECGRSMKCSGIKSGKRKHIYYQCKNYVQRACDGKKMLRSDVAESVLVQHLIERAAAIAQLAQTPPEYVEPAELQQLRSQLQGLEALGHNPAFETAKNDLRSQIGALVEQSKTKNVVDDELQQTLIDSFSDPEYWNWEGHSCDRKRQIYRALIEKVIIREGAVEKVFLKV